MQRAVQNFLTLTRKEAAGILLSPPILFATAFFVLLDSFAFFLAVSQGRPLAVFDDIALFMLFTSIVMFPLVSMHSFAEDNAGGTLETLLTAPVSRLNVILAKYAGGMVFVVLYLLHGVVYAVLLSRGGRLDWNSTAAAFLALFAVGSLAISLGVCVAALTMSPAAAAAGTGGVLIFMALAADLDPYAGMASDVLYSISFVTHARRWIAGQLDTRGLVYFLSSTALFLYCAWLAVSFRLSERRSRNTVVRRRTNVTYALVAAGAAMLLLQAALLHIYAFWETDTPLGPNLARVPYRFFLPALLAAAAFVWAVFTFRAAKRAARAERPGQVVRRYASISDSTVMKAPTFYYEENLRARRRVAVAAVAALAITLNLNWLSHYPFRTFEGSEALGFLAHLQERSWDVTEDKRNSLSPITIRALDTLQGRAQIYSFLPDGLQVREVPVADEMRLLLRRYAEHESLVSVTFADAERDPELAAELAAELQITQENLGQLIVVDYQGRRAFIPAAALAVAPDWRQQMAGNDRWVFDGENRLTQELLRLADPRMPNVYFTYGHRELALEAGAYPERSASVLARLMSGANMRLRQHAIAQSGPVPPDCDVLIVAAPRVPFLRGEVDEIARYLDSGGRLMVFAPVAGPDFAAAADPLNALLFDLGGGIRDDVVEDALHNSNGQAFSPLGRTKNAGEGGAELVFTLTRTVRDNPDAVENGWTVERMIETHPSAVATDLASGEKSAGPFTLVYRASKETGGREARVAAIASGRMASDSGIGRGANESLLRGLVQWLGGREEAADLPPRQWVDRTLAFSGVGLRAVLWIALVALPLAWLAAGISVWWVRRD